MTESLQEKYMIGNLVNPEKYISNQIEDAIRIKGIVLHDENFQKQIMKMANSIVNAYQNGHLLILCGNGGSAGDAQHIAGEMTARFKMERKPLPALALNTNSSIVTAIGNDYEYNEIFRRQVEAFGKSGDVLLAISTSGNSESVIRAMQEAKKQGMMVLSLLGKNGGKCQTLADCAFVVPSDDTARIQEVHIMVGHIICDIVEQILFSEPR